MKSCLLILHLENKDRIHKNLEGSYAFRIGNVINFIIICRQSERVRAVQDQIQEYGNGSTITEVCEYALL